MSKHRHSSSSAGQTRNRFFLAMAVSLFFAVCYAVIFQQSIPMKIVASRNLDNGRPNNLSSVHRQNTTTSNVFKQAHRKYTAVVILTYMRSGSSLTGDVIQQYPDAFYVFEPMKTIDIIYKNRMNISFLNGTILKFGNYSKPALYKETLRGWLTCDFKLVPLSSLSDLFFLSFGRKTKSLSACLEREGPRYMKWYSHWPELRSKSRKFLKCVSQLEMVCEKSKYRVIKTIRTDLEDAWSVLKDLPDSKLIHLVRDPRATILSQRKRGRCIQELDGMVGCTHRFCNRMRTDTVNKRILQEKYKDVFTTVSYEEMAVRPIETAKRLYEFLGMDFTANISKYVYDITLGENKTGCDICQVKWQIGNSNSSSEKHVDLWKTQMNPSTIHTIQLLCEDVLKTYGYEYYPIPRNLLYTETSTETVPAQKNTSKKKPAKNLYVRENRQNKTKLEP